MITYGRLPTVKGLELVDEFTVRKTKDLYPVTEFLITHFMNHPSEKVVDVLNFQYLGDATVGNYSDKKYFYEMKRLGILTSGEKELVARAGVLLENFLVFENALIPTQFSKEYINSTKPFVQEFPELAHFLSDIIREGHYWDIHSGNVMRHPDGGYRLIDLEGFVNSVNIADYGWLHDM
jgi:hypothetical protein